MSRTIDIVRRMVDAGSANVLMGNHEFNVIGFALRGSSRKHLIIRTERSVRQHASVSAGCPDQSRRHRDLV